MVEKLITVGSWIVGAALVWWAVMKIGLIFSSVWIGFRFILYFFARRKIGSITTAFLGFLICLIPVAAFFHFFTWQGWGNEASFFFAGFMTLLLEILLGIAVGTILRQQARKVASKSAG